MPDKEIARADDLVAEGLALPNKEGQEYLSAVVSNLIGMTAETEEARAAQEQKNEALKDELDYVKAQNEHMMRVLQERGINVEQTGFTYTPTLRRRRQSVVRKPIDILLDLVGLRPPHVEEKPQIVEATPTGSITSLPKPAPEPEAAVEAEVIDDSGELQIIEQQGSLADYLERSRAAEPAENSIDYGEPQYHRTTTIDLPQVREDEDHVIEPHPTRGIDIAPSYTHVPSDMDISTGKIILPVTPVTFDELLVPQPKTAASVILSEEEPDISNQPEAEDRRSRRERVRAERLARKERRKARK